MQRLKREIVSPVLEHPCFSNCAHGRFGRIHLPVAPQCNIQCAYCDRRYDCANESRPGVTSTVLTPEEAVDRTARALEQEPRIRVAGIAGPGEPLANEETFATLRLLRRQFPKLTLCVSTNGLLLLDSLDELLSYGVSTLTITINAITSRTADRIYLRVGSDKRPLPPEMGIPLLLKRQWEGLKAAVQCGLVVKVNVVLIPGINDEEISPIAARAADFGAYIMNVMPLIPCGNLVDFQRPTKEQLTAARRIAKCRLPQFIHCKQCRADACGVPGLE